MNNNVHFCRCIQSQLPTTAPHMPRVYSRMVDNVQALIYQAGEGLCLYQDTGSPIAVEFIRSGTVIYHKHFTYDQALQKQHIQNKFWIYFIICKTYKDHLLNEELDQDLEQVMADTRRETQRGIIVNESMKQLLEETLKKIKINDDRIKKNDDIIKNQADIIKNNDIRIKNQADRIKNQADIIKNDDIRIKNTGKSIRASTKEHNELMRKTDEILRNLNKTLKAEQEEEGKLNKGTVQRVKFLHGSPGKVSLVAGSLAIVVFFYSFFSGKYSIQSIFPRKITDYSHSFQKIPQHFITPYWFHASQIHYPKTSFSRTPAYLPFFDKSCQFHSSDRFSCNFAPYTGPFAPEEKEPT